MLTINQLKFCLPVIYHYQIQSLFKFYLRVFHRHGLTPGFVKNYAGADGLEHGQALRVAIGCSQETPAKMFYELLYLLGVHISAPFAY